MPIQFPTPPTPPELAWGYPGLHHANMATTDVDVDYASATSGLAVVKLFRARFDLTFDSMHHIIGARNGATVSNFRMGLYAITSVSAAPTGTLVARIADDPTAVTPGTYNAVTRALDTTGGYPASYTIRAGSWYATGWIVVATTTPQMYADYYSPFSFGDVSLGYRNSLTDLPTTLASFIWYSGGVCPYIALLP